jgi:hypothetical protein
LAWKTSLDKIPFSEAGVSAVTVDTKNQEVYWAYGVTRGNSTADYATYEGTLYRMNLLNGQNLTKTQFQSTATMPFFTQNNPTIGLALLKNTAYLTAQTDLWCFNRTSLTAISTEHFDHTLLKPIAAYGRVYVTADLYAMSYKDIEN